MRTWKAVRSYTVCLHRTLQNHKKMLTFCNKIYGVKNTSSFKVSFCSIYNTCTRARTQLSNAKQITYDFILVLCGYEAFLQLWKEWRWWLKTGRGCHETDKWCVCDRTNKQTNMKLFCSQLKGNCFPRSLSLTVFCFRRQSLCHCAYFSVMSLTQCIFQRQGRQPCVHLIQYSFQRNIADTALFSAISCRFARKFTSDFSHQHSFQISCSILSRQVSWSIAIAELATVLCEQSVPIWWATFGRHQGTA